MSGVSNDSTSETTPPVMFVGYVFDSQTGTLTMQPFSTVEEAAAAGKEAIEAAVAYQHFHVKHDDP